MMNLVRKSGAFFKALRGIVLVLALAGGGSVAAISADELDTAIRETSNYLNAHLTKGSKLVILDIQSAFPLLSEYILDELIANTVNDKVFTVVDRQQIDAVREELNFQMSGDVSDDSAQALGRMLGAQLIISGAVSKFGDLYRLRVRALSVQTAQIEGQFNRNIPNGPTIAALTGTPSATPAPSTAVSPTPSATPSAAPTASNTPALTAPTQAAASVDYSRHGLYAGTTFQGRLDLYDALEWITLNAQANGVYTFVMESDQKVSNISLDYGGQEGNRISESHWRRTQGNLRHRQAFFRTLHG